MSLASSQGVLMIGLDSADINYIQEHIEELENLKRLRDIGSFHRLETPGKHMTAAVWSTFYTGSEPGEHGFYYPMQWDAKNMRLRRVLQDWFYLEPFWYDLAREGYPVTAVDVQTQFPSRIPLGTEVTNWGSQSYLGMKSSNPKLLQEIKKRFGNHPMGHDVLLKKTPKKLESIFQETLEGVRTRGQLLRYMLAQTDWKLFLGAFTECHRAGHIFWPYDDNDTKLLTIFQAIDDEIGKLLDLINLENTTVVIFSLHGMGPNYTQMHFLPQIMDRINEEFVYKKLGLNKAQPQQKSLFRILRENLPTELQYIIAQRTSDAVRDKVVEKQYIGAKDWGNTLGFLIPSGSEGYIRLNLKGREKFGCLELDSEQYHQYRNFVVDCFKSLKLASTGETIVKRVMFADEVYPGSCSDLLPDIIVNWKELEPAEELDSEILGKMKAQLETGRGGNHRDGSFAIVAGASKPSEQIPLNKISDFANFTKTLIKNH